MKSLSAIGFIAFLTLSAASQAGNKYVPSPAPPINDGKPAQIEREISDDASIIHISRATRAREFQLIGDYLANLQCSGEVPLSADLRTVTSPQGSSDEELIFLSLPKSMEDECVLSIVSRETWPWTRVFNGKISSIPIMKE